ncbi:hypothetical protein [Arthrospira sp. PCC 8006]
MTLIPHLTFRKIPLIYIKNIPQKFRNYSLFIYMLIKCKIP